jgi:hypothetical protein
MISEQTQRNNHVETGMDTAKLYENDAIRLLNLIVPRLGMAGGFKKSDLTSDMKFGTDSILISHGCKASFRVRTRKTWFHVFKNDDMLVRYFTTVGRDTEFHKFCLRHVPIEELPEINLYFCGDDRYADKNAPLEKVIPWFRLVHWPRIIDSEIYLPKVRYSRYDSQKKIRWTTGDKNELDGSKPIQVEFRYLDEIDAVLALSDPLPNYINRKDTTLYTDIIDGEKNISFHLIDRALKGL